uniref:Uncharacterized protein n=1 Tax=Kalanchoe fedtschenkoi TaxID=63787 RepID=A0A7N0V4C0_KALFE
MNGNLNQALTFMQRVMTSSEIERLIKNAPTRHYKKSEKHVFSKKALERRLGSRNMARKVNSILIQKIKPTKIESINLSPYPPSYASGSQLGGDGDVSRPALASLLTQHSNDVAC